MHATLCLVVCLVLCLVTCGKCTYTDSNCESCSWEETLPPIQCAPPKCPLGCKIQTEFDGPCPGCDCPDQNVPVCEQEKKTGPCRANMNRFYYNQETGECEKFVYGGCQGNDNNFKTKEQCEEQCCDDFPLPVCDPPRCDEPGCRLKDVENSICPICVCDEDVPVCEQPKKVGPCKAAVPRYYFNKRSGRCEKFIYGGCQANDNNFETEDECEERCGGERSVCDLPKDQGSCYAHLERYYYNGKKDRCEKFIYGGCKGNGNNFESIDECTDECGGDSRPPIHCPIPRCREGCELKTPKGGKRCSVCVCDDTLPPRDCPLPKCKGGCELKAVKGQRCPQCVCGHPDDCPFKKCKAGCVFKIVDGERCPNCVCDETNPPRECPQIKCRAECPPKILEGRRCPTCVCDDNPPVQCSIPACPVGCTIKSVEGQQCPVCDCDDGGDHPHVCHLPRCDVGCKIKPVEGQQCPICDCDDEPITLPPIICDSPKCDKGCRIEKKEGAICPSCICDDVCSLDKEVGPCKARFPRYYFNKYKGQCELFDYGGCRGNGNNFETLEECEDACGSVPPIQCLPPKCAPGCTIQTEYDGPCPGCDCSGNNIPVCEQEKKVGPCLAIFPRFFYNKETACCESFTYGGCQGNDNNFETIEECEATCEVSECGTNEEVVKCAKPKSCNTCALRGNCSMKKCIKGCDCKAGYYRDKFGICMPEDQCPGPEEQCSPKESYYDCIPSCRGTCKALNNKDEIFCNQLCIPGCFCREGLYKTDNGDCVPPELCPNGW